MRKHQETGAQVSDRSGRGIHAEDARLSQVDVSIDPHARAGVAKMTRAPESNLIPGRGISFDQRILVEPEELGPRLRNQRLARRRRRGHDNPRRCPQPCRGDSDDCDDDHGSSDDAGSSATAPRATARRRYDERCVVGLQPRISVHRGGPAAVASFRAFVQPGPQVRHRRPPTRRAAVSALGASAPAPGPRTIRAARRSRLPSPVRSPTGIRRLGHPAPARSVR